MQITTSEEQAKRNFKMKNLPPEDRSKLVGFFALLIKVDKRINPALYQIKQMKND
jgi:hypothetical protein